MKKTLRTIDVINYLNFFNNISKSTMDGLPLKIKWYLKRIVDKMMPDSKAFEEFRDAEAQKIRDVYFDDVHSENVVVVKKDKDGNPELDSEGNEITEESRKVKDEYIMEYKTAVEELNKRLEEILYETTTYEYNRVDIDEYIDTIDEKVVDFTTLSLIDELFKED